MIHHEQLLTRRLSRGFLHDRDFIVPSTVVTMWHSARSGPAAELKTQQGLLQSLQDDVMHQACCRCQQADVMWPGNLYQKSAS